MTEAETIQALQFKIEELQLEVARANDMERYWRDGHEAFFKKHYEVPPVKATFSGGVNLKEMHWEYAKGRLHRAGLLKLLDILDVRAVKIVDFTTLADLHDSFGTIDAPSRSILIDDSLPFPWPVLPSTIIHEAMHLYQTDIGMIGTGIKKREFQAYTLSQVFHWLNEDGIGVFHVDTGVSATWPVAIDLAVEYWG